MNRELKRTRWCAKAGAATGTDNMCLARIGCRNSVVRGNRFIGWFVELMIEAEQDGKEGGLRAVAKEVCHGLA